MVRPNSARVRPEAAAAAAIALGTLAACGSGGGGDTTAGGAASSCQSVEARAAHPASAQSTKHQGLEKLAEEVSARTDGRVEISVYPESQLGSLGEMPELLASDTVQLALIDLGTLAQIEPELGAFELPYVFDDEFDEFHAVMDGAAGELVADRLLASANIQPLYWVSEGAHNLFTVDATVDSADDLRGLKLRVLDTPGQVAMIEAFGAAPTPVATPDTYNALVSGAVEGLGFPNAPLLDLSIDETVSHMAMTHHMITNIGIHAGRPFLDRLCAEDQEALFAAAEVARDLNRDLARTANDEAVAELQDALEVTEPDLTGFQEAAEEMREEFRATAGSELLDAIEAAKS